MKERLVELWLDSVGEREYQNAFCQSLVFQGHEILHSTRHSPIEFGKDVVSRGPDGKIYGFQLKGNPSSRLTFTQFRAIRVQLTELVETPIRAPGIRNVLHQSVLVTNGQIDEEALLAIHDFNKNLIERGYPEEQCLQVWSRGILLHNILKALDQVRFENIELSSHFIRLCTSDGKSNIDSESLSRFFDISLNISKKDTKYRKRIFEKDIISISILSSLISKGYTEEHNFDANIKISTMLISHIVSALERYGWNQAGVVDQIIKFLEQDILYNMQCLLSEFYGRYDKLRQGGKSEGIDLNRLFIEDNGISDSVTWKARALKTASIFSILDIFGRNSIINIQKKEQKLLDNILNNIGPRNIDIWAEAAMPQVLAVWWWQIISDATVRSNWLGPSVLGFILQRAIRKDLPPLPGPYHELDDVMLDRIKAFIGNSYEINPDELGKETSFYAEGLYHCFIAFNIKTVIAEIWPNFSKIIHLSFCPEHKYQFGLWRSKNGKNTQKIYDVEYKWSKLYEDAKECGLSGIPIYYTNNPLMLLLFIIYFPHRGNSSICRYLQKNICTIDFMPA